jgi:hypothetical protein
VIKLIIIQIINGLFFFLLKTLATQENLSRMSKTLRLDAGLPQEQLALDADIDRTYASQIERAIGNPSLKVICKLSEVLKISPVELLGQ